MSIFLSNRFTERMSHCLIENSVQTPFLALTFLLSHNLPKQIVVNIPALDNIKDAKYETSPMTVRRKFYHIINSAFLIVKMAVLTTNYKNLKSSKVMALQTILQLFLKLYSVS